MLNARTIVSALGWMTACLAMPQLTAALAQTPPDARERMNTYLASDASFEGVFSVADDGGAIHVQSRLHCPPSVGNAFLSSLMAYDSPSGAIGHDIGCDYGRRDPDNPSLAAAKHTIFAIKLPGGWSLDDAFEQYRGEMYQAVPQAEPDGPSITFEDDAADLFPPVRSEEAYYPDGDRTIQTEVIVTVLDDWIIEIRSTRKSQYDVRDEEELADNMVSSYMLLGAFESFGRMSEAAGDETTASLPSQ